MRMYDIIRKKRDRGELSCEEIRFFVNGYTDGSIPDYQAAALLTAICINGMCDREICDLTEAMASSGEQMELSRFGGLTADKHSTGGVGDKTSLIVAPTAAALGIMVAKMSGRGLGHTGGTIDKLESIPGYRTELSKSEFMSQVERIGVALIGQTAELAPADKKIYALRDVTATVDSIPLIASSIMSKKLASGSKSIVLDVKYGSGAFMKTPEEARLLAEKMVEIGKRSGRKTAALISDMNTPLGSEIGNALEVKEAVAVLKGELDNDLREVSLQLVGHMAALALNISVDEGVCRARQAIDDGSAYKKLLEWISAQGGDTAFIENTKLFPQASTIFDIKAERDGYICFTDAESIGVAATLLGAGRRKKDDIINHAAGITMLHKRGELVKKGDTVMLLHTDEPTVLYEAEALCRTAIRYSDTPPDAVPHIYCTVS